MRPIPRPAEIHMAEFLRARIDEEESAARQSLANALAKRRIVRYHLGCTDATPCPTLLLLAEAYADHPQFDPAWRA